MPNGQRNRIAGKEGVLRTYNNIDVVHEEVGNYVKITIKFSPLRPLDATTYYVRFESLEKKNSFVHIPLVTINMGITRLAPQVVEVLPGQRLNMTTLYFTCNKCVVRGIMLRGDDGTVKNVDIDKYRIRKFTDEKGMEQSYVEIDFDEMSPHNFGDYFLMIQNDDGGEERIKALTIKAPQSDPNNAINALRLRVASTVGDHLDKTISYTCDDCELNDVMCRGESVLPAGRVTLIPTSKTVNVNFPGFEDTNSCVYIGIFKRGENTYRKIVAIIENSAPSVTVEFAGLIPPPQEGEQFEQEIKYSCTGDCSVEKVNVNGIPLETNTRRSNVGSIAFYVLTENLITIRITEFSEPYAGMYQAIFNVDGEQITKNLMEIGNAVTEALDAPPASNETPAPATEAASNEAAPNEPAPNDAAPNEPAPN
ncbi:uncharacterized protein LOC113508911 isoform X1 [Trichoplusia ni]|nr:uncharacterized protein LOC113508911 isoform X1 [Trichoplusia ni]